MKLRNLELKLINFEEQVTLFLKSIGAYTLTEEQFKRYFNIRRKNINKKYS